jgi:hypothetical protein
MLQICFNERKKKTFSHYWYILGSNFRTITFSIISLSSPCTVSTSSASSRSPISSLCGQPSRGTFGVIKIAFSELCCKHPTQLANYNKCLIKTPPISGDAIDGNSFFSVHAQLTKGTKVNDKLSWPKAPKKPMLPTLASTGMKLEFSMDEKTFSTP